jgi:hypothetical protein
MRALAPGLVLAVAVLCGSCGDEITYEVLPGLETGALRIEVVPESVDAPWSLTLPGGGTASGSGSAYLPSMPAGTYTIAWGDVGDWDSPTPNPFTETLAAGTELEFRGEYIYAPPLGTIIVDVQPNDTYAPWSLGGPDGYVLDGEGDRTLDAMPLGEYTLTWGDVAFYFTPEVNPVTGQLDQSAPLVLAGVYSPDDSIDRVGIYADSLGHVRAVAIEPYAVVELFIIAHVPSLEGGLQVVGLSAVNWLDPGPAGIVQIDWETDLMVGNLVDGIALAFGGDPAYPDENHNVLLGVARVLSLDPAWPAPNTEVTIGGQDGPYPVVVGTDVEEIEVAGDRLLVNPSNRTR